MTKFLLVLGFFISAFSASSQDSTKVKPVVHDTVKVNKPIRKIGPSPETIARRKKMDQIFAKYARDHLVLDLNGTNWLYNPNNPQFQGMQAKWFSRGLNIYFNWDFRIKGSRVSLAPGIGYSCANIYSHSRLIQDTTGIHFTPLDYGNDTTAKINKIAFQYLEIPLELRIRSNPDKLGNCVKVAVGFKGGVLVDVHTKIKLIEDGVTQVFVTRRYDDVNMWRIGPTIRVGYSFFNVTAFYGLLNMFKPGLGPPAHEFSLGISFMAL